MKPVEPASNSGLKVAGKILRRGSKTFVA